MIGSTCGRKSAERRRSDSSETRYRVLIFSSTVPDEARGTDGRSKGKSLAFDEVMHSFGGGDKDIDAERWSPVPG